jgi:hypothetical protein
MIAVRRRDFIKGIAGSSIAWALAARAQQAEKVRRIGVLMAHREDDTEFQEYLVVFRQIYTKYPADCIDAARDAHCAGGVCNRCGSGREWFC